MSLYSFSWFSKQNKYRNFKNINLYNGFLIFPSVKLIRCVPASLNILTKKIYFYTPIFKTTCFFLIVFMTTVFQAAFFIVSWDCWQFICMNGKIMNMIHNTIRSPVWGWIYPSWQSDLFLQLLVSPWELLNGCTVLFMDIVTWNIVRGFRSKITDGCCLQRNGHNGCSGHCCLGNFDTYVLAN